MNSNYKRGVYNLLYGVLGQVISVALGICVPRLVLVNLGSESNGLMSSVNQILAYLCILETGVGTATVQALYRPVAVGDRTKISEILAATGRYYRVTGFTYAACVLALAFIFPLTVPSELPFSTISVVILVSGLPNVISYFYQAKFKLLLQVEGKNYIIANLTTICTIIVNISKIVLLMMGFNIIAVQTAYMVLSLLQVAFFAYYIKKNYSWLDKSATPDNAAISQKNSAMVHQISSMVFSNTDMLIITLLCGFNLVSVYTVYAMLFGVIKNVLRTINESVYFAMGQCFASDRERFKKMNDAFEVCNMALTFSVFCVANRFIEPFVRLYTDGVTDIDYILPYLPILFIAGYLLSCGRTSSLKVIDYAGHFKETQWRSILETGINLVVSIFLVFRLNIYGVLIGTVVALLYRTNDMIIYASKRILKRSPWIVYRRWLLCLLLFCGFTWLFRFVPMDLSAYWKIAIWTIASCAVVVPSFFVIALTTEQKTAAFLLGLVKQHTKKGFSKSDSPAKVS